MQAASLRLAALASESSVFSILLLLQVSTEVTIKRSTSDTYLNFSEERIAEILAPNTRGFNRIMDKFYRTLHPRSAFCA